MTDIPSLIERVLQENLRLVCKECGHGGVEVCDCIWMVKPGCIEECAKLAAEALCRLTASPLPEEIEDHLKFLRTYSSHPGITEAAVALQRLAREVERLKEECEIQRKGAGAFAESCYVAEKQRDGFRAEREKARARITELEADRNAIRAKTIEECAALFEPPPNGWGQVDLHRAQARIRALNQPEAGGGE